MRSLILAAILVMVNASPVDPAPQERAATANLCSKVKNVVRASPTALLVWLLTGEQVTNGGYQSIATKFCSSYLSIPAGSTATSIVTRPTCVPNQRLLHIISLMKFIKKYRCYDDRDCFHKDCPRAGYKYNGYHVRDISKAL